MKKHVLPKGSGFRWLLLTTRLKISPGRRQTSWLISSVAQQVYSGLPCKKLQLVVRAELEPGTYAFQVHSPNHSATQNVYCCVFHVCNVVLFGDTQYFRGNKDRNTVVTNTLSTPIRARYIRILPWSWYGHISMRAEFYGCYVGKFLLTDKTHGETSRATSRAIIFNYTVFVLLSTAWVLGRTLHVSTSGSEVLLKAFENTLKHLNPRLAVQLCEAIRGSILLQFR